MMFPKILLLLAAILQQDPQSTNYGASAFVPAFTTQTSTIQTSSKTTKVYSQLPSPGGRADIDIVFGSVEEHRERGLSKQSDDDDDEEDGNVKNDQYGLYEDDLDEDQRDRIERQEKIEKLLQQQESSLREERKQKQWGKFANVTSKEDLEAILKAEKEKIEQGTSMYLCVCTFIYCIGCGS